MSLRAKLLLLLTYLPATLFSLGISVFLLRSYSSSKEVSTKLKVQAQAEIPKNRLQMYAALPQVLGSVTTSVDAKDARPEILKQFLEKHNSPIAPFSQVIVNASDAYSVDFRLISAIAMCESNLGKKMPEGSYNAWGYAIYTGEKSGAEFENWEQGISVMAHYLSTKYYSKNLTTPEEIGPIYAPPSVNTGNSWAKCVRGFMDELL